MLPIKTSSLLLHLVGLFIFLCFPLVFLSAFAETQKIPDILADPAYWIFTTSFVGLFYLNYYLLVPKLYLQKRYLAYGGAVLLLFALFALAKPFEQIIKHADRHNHTQMQTLRPPLDGPPHIGHDHDGPMRHMRHHNKPGFDFVSTFLFIMFMVSGIALQTNARLQRSEKRVLQAEAEKANAELSFLKAQINPHFLFNTLNNIYAMSITGSVHTSASILRLSNIMRYVTDEAVQDFVNLQNEADCIADYIDLQRLRLNQAAEVGYTVSGQLERHTIPPLLLITFIENTFKYGISKREKPEITIALEAEERSFSFFCKNKILRQTENIERTGIGIANARKRLNYLYPNKHQLVITEADGYFTVNLTIDS